MSFSNRFLPYLLLIISVTWAWTLALSGKLITGPFIFGDESTYFDFARTLFFGKDLSFFTQYGPLYPAFIAMTFFAKNVIATYKLTKLLNILFYISAVIPAYILSKALFTNVWLRWLFPFFVLFSPFSSFVYLVWAEPLYYTLFYSTVLFLYLFIKQPTLIRSFLLGMFIASLYYTKTAAGLIAEIAFVITMGVYYLSENKHKSKALLSILVCVLLTLPWMIHYKYLGVSIVGYPVATASLTAKFSGGVLSLISKIMFSFFYQLSYVIIGSWTMFGIAVTLLMTQWKNIEIAARTLMLFLILCLCGLMCLNAVGMTTLLDFHMPNGRYYSPLFPIITVLTLHLLFQMKLEKKSFILMLVALLLMTVIMYVAPPLYTRSPFSFNTMPELAPIIYLSDHGQTMWRAVIERPSTFLRGSVALFFSMIAFLILRFRNTRITPCLTSIFLSTCILFMGLSEKYYMHGVAIGQSTLNNIYIQLIKKNISLSEVGFDKDLKESNVQFITPFWMNGRAEFVNANDKHYFVSKKELTLNKLFVSDLYTIYEN